MSRATRTEQDALGEVTLPRDALYGVHAVRARENFPDHHRFHVEWYRALGIVKRVCYETIRKLQQAATDRYSADDIPWVMMTEEALDALTSAADEVAGGHHFDHFIVPGISGGAGTSINMNINEIICNRALSLLGEAPGNHRRLDPIEHANRYQSTNDVVPTALKVAVMDLLDELEAGINRLRMGFEALEAAHRNVLRTAYTQLQQAVPSSYGKLFSTYQEALSRDWWRISKCIERIKVVNLGGSAVGTGITVPKFFIFEAVEGLRRATGKPLTRGDNLQDTTSNLDDIVEVHGILKAHAVNLEKIASDLRLLSSDAFAERAMTIPKRQVGSSIMPGKVNPVISEYVISVAHEVYASDVVITALAGQGLLDLNAYLPSIGHHLIGSVKQLTSASASLLSHLVAGIALDGARSEALLFKSPVITTALLPYIGYRKAERLAQRMRDQNEDIFAANEELTLMNRERLNAVLSPANLLKLGFQIADVMERRDEP